MSEKILSLTKENFWNELSENYPDEMKQFCAWIDQYKQWVDWNLLFNSHRFSARNGQECVNVPPKYHELPIGMQIGIFIEYTLSPSEKLVFLPIGDSMEEIAGKIKKWFATKARINSQKPKF